MSNRIKSQKIEIGDSYVLPIEQSKVTIQQAKVKRIIEETGLKAQQIIDDAEKKSQEILSNANIQGEHLIQDAKNRAEKEYEATKQLAYDEGFLKGQEDGLAKFKEDAIESLHSLEVLCSKNFEIKKNIIDSATVDIIELISQIADKICHLSFDKEMLKKITIDAIKLLNDKENVTIIVNPKLTEDINSLREDFKEEIPQLKSIKILEDNSVSPDGVIVETLSTRLDSRISTQISEITQKMLTGTTDGVE